jgi:cyanophycin synthetase
METARGGIVRSGLGYSASAVAACLNVTSDHLGSRGVDTLEQLAEVKRVVVESATDTVVLNADDLLCLEMADYTHAEKLCYVTLDPTHALVKEHIRAEGMALVLEQGINGEMITIYDKGAHIPLLWTHLIPATIEGKAIHNVQNAMFAAAMAYAMGKSLEDIRHGLRTFNTTFFQAPGRMNVFDEHPFKVILDYAHNPAAVGAMCQLSDRLDVIGRRVCVISSPGDRRDEDVNALASTAAGHFDHYICKADDDRRGRGDTEIPQMIRAQLILEGVDESAIEMIADEQASVAHALDFCDAGDLLVVFGDDITRCWKQIINVKTDDSGLEIENRKENGSEATEVVEHFELSDGQSLIRDERGVRIAKTEEGDD